jgi:hypothetical protein
VVADHLYPPDAVSALEDERQRRFLTEVGLPAEDMLFLATPTLVRPAAGREFLKIGETDEDDWFAVDTATGEVVSLLVPHERIQHVNASPTAFGASLAEFGARFPYGGTDSDLNEREDLAGHLARALLRIDPTALTDGTVLDRPFWEDIIADIWVGDYSEG